MKWTFGNMGLISIKKNMKSKLGNVPLNEFKQLEVIFVFNEKDLHHPSTLRPPLLNQPPFRRTRVVLGCGVQFLTIVGRNCRAHILIDISVAG